MLILLRRLTPVLLALVVIGALLIAVSILVGHTQPFPQRVEHLHLMDCAPPCWDGITLRLSSPSEVKDRIRASFPSFSRSQAVDNSEFLTWAEFDQFNRISSGIGVRFVDGLATAIHITTNYASAETPNLGEAVAVFGTPTCVRVDNGSEATSLWYENSAQHFYIRLSALQAALSSPVTLISFGLMDESTCAHGYGTSWHNFRNANHLYFLAS